MKLLVSLIASLFIVQSYAAIAYYYAQINSYPYSSSITTPLFGGAFGWIDDSDNFLHLNGSIWNVTANAPSVPLNQTQMSFLPLVGHLHGPTSRVALQFRPPILGNMAAELPMRLTDELGYEFSLSVSLSGEQKFDLNDGNFYIDIHLNQTASGGSNNNNSNSNANTDVMGLIRGTIVRSSGRFVAKMDGVQAGVNNDYIGACEFYFDESSRSLSPKNIWWKGFNGTAAHIQGPAPRGLLGDVQIILISAPVAPSEDPVVVTEAVNFEFQQLILTPIQLYYLFAGLLYVNVRSTSNPQGEIRGQIFLAVTEATDGHYSTSCGNSSIIEVKETSCTFFNQTQFTSYYGFYNSSSSECDDLVGGMEVSGRFIDVGLNEVAYGFDKFITSIDTVIVTGNQDFADVWNAQCPMCLVVPLVATSCDSLCGINLLYRTMLIFDDDLRYFAEGLNESVWYSVSNFTDDELLTGSEQSDECETYGDFNYTLPSNDTGSNMSTGGDTGSIESSSLSSTAVTASSESITGSSSSESSSSSTADTGITWSSTGGNESTTFSSTGRNNTASASSTQFSPLVVFILICSVFFF